MTGLIRLALTGAVVVGAVGIVLTKRKEIEELTDKVIEKTREKDMSVMAADTTGDGEIDTVVADVNGDGAIDTVLVDTTGDGQLDTAMIDSDGDGTIDTVLDLTEKEESISVKDLSEQMISQIQESQDELKIENRNKE